MNREKSTPVIDLRQTVRRASWSRLLIIVAATLLILIASLLSHLRFDWTEDRIYTLSESTLSVLNQLEEPVLIRAYVTSGLPQPYGRLNRFLEDILLSYHDAGAGNVGFEVVNPADDLNVAASLAAMKIPKVQVQTIEDDQAQVKQGYLAVVIEYLDSREIIPVIQSEEGFEYALTRKIRKLAGTEKVKVAIASGFGASEINRLHKLKELLDDEYELITLRLGEEPVPVDVKTVIISGLEQTPSEKYRYHIDQFRMRGGALLLLAGSVKPQLSEGFQVKPLASGSLEWMKEDLGIAIEPGLIMDRQATRVTVNQHQNGFMIKSLVDYPFLPSVTLLENNHPVTDGLEGLSVPFASPLTWVGRGNVTISELMRSSEQSALQSGPPFDVNPLIPTETRFADIEQGSSVLALAIEGEHVSVFDQAKGDKFRMIVVGAPSFFDNEFMSGSNLVATLNMIDWLSGDEQLITLRSRGVTQRPIAELSSTGRAFFKGIWVFGLPILVALIGLWRWWALNRRRSLSEA